MDKSETGPSLWLLNVNLFLYFSSKDEAGSTAPYESAYIYGGGHSEADEGRCYLGEGAWAVKLDLCAGLNPDSPGPQFPLGHVLYNLEY